MHSATSDRNIDEPRRAGQYGAVWTGSNILSFTDPAEPRMVRERDAHVVSGLCTISFWIDRPS